MPLASNSKGSIFKGPNYNLKPDLFISITKPVRSPVVKENDIGSAVSEIICYRQKKTNYFI